MIDRPTRCGLALLARRRASAYRPRASSGESEAGAQSSTFIRRLSHVQASRDWARISRRTTRRAGSSSRCTPRCSLGGEKEALERPLGALHSPPASVSAPWVRLVDASTVFNLPFLFRDRTSHMDKVIDCRRQEVLARSPTIRDALVRLAGDWIARRTSMRHQDDCQNIDDLNVLQVRVMCNRGLSP